MPHVCSCGRDTYLCQACAEVFCDTPQCPQYRRAAWVRGWGNICCACLGSRPCRACRQRPPAPGDRYCRPCADEIRQMVDEYHLDGRPQ